MKPGEVWYYRSIRSNRIIPVRIVRVAHRVGSSQPRFHVVTLDDPPKTIHPPLYVSQLLTKEQVTARVLMGEADQTS